MPRRAVKSSPEFIRRTAPQSRSRGNRADLWLARCQRDALEPATTLAYRQHLNLHILHRWLGLACGPDAPIVDTFRDQLLDDGQYRDMTRRVLASLAALVGEAQTRGFVAVNNVRAVAKVRRGRRTEMRFAMPTQDELKAIVAATPNRHRALILTALLAGLRASELRGLLWGDVDLKRAIHAVRRRGSTNPSVRVAKIGSRCARSRPARSCRTR